MLVLSHPSLGDLDVDDGIGYVTESLTMPTPAVREVVDNRSEADGTVDQTRFTGSRAVAIAVACFAAEGVSLEARVDALRRYLHPSLRSTLTWTPVGESSPRQLTVRAVSHDCTIADPRWARTTVALVAPSGLVESGGPAGLHVVTILPSSGVDAGRTYDHVPDRDYPPSTFGSGTIVTNAGSAPAHWVARLYGPADNPVLTNTTLGLSLPFSLSVSSGHYIEVNQLARTALLDSDPALSVHLNLDTGARWWALAPGDNLVTYGATTFLGAAYAELEWRDAWL